MLLSEFPHSIYSHCCTTNAQSLKAGESAAARPYLDSMSHVNACLDLHESLHGMLNNTIVPIKYPFLYFCALPCCCITCNQTRHMCCCRHGWCHACQPGSCSSHLDSTSIHNGMVIWDARWQTHVHNISGGWCCKQLAMILMITLSGLRSCCLGQMQVTLIEVAFLPVFTYY